MIGTINTTQNKVSGYQPSSDVIELTKIVQEDYSQGIEIIQKPWVELNDRSVVEDTNRGLLMFNGYVDTSTEDPSEEWKWRGTRSMARNKAIAMHAQLTANYLLPLFIAQNEKSEIDRDFSEIMQDLVEWLAQPTVSNYQSSFIQIVFSMMYNPVTYLGAEFCEIYQMIKEEVNGRIIKKKVLDDMLSGFKSNIYSPTQILITNPYERNLQKQRSIIKRRFVEYKELEAKYKDHENWKYVTKGLKSVYNTDDGLFYDIYDEDHPNLVAEETWVNRREDLEVPFVNGIYLGKSNVEANLVIHRDNTNKPKYNLVPFGYMRIGEHFFYYKSMMNALTWDNMAYDAMSEIVMNRAILETEMPIAVSGVDKIDSDVIFPNSVVAFEDKETRITPLLPQSNLAAGFNVLRETEKSISEGSVNETISGSLPDASQKAFNVAQAQANAKKLIGAVGKSLGESIVQYGDLMKDIVINHITVPEIDELVGDKMTMKYKTFLLENKKSNGKLVDKSIQFDSSLLGVKMSKAELKKESYKLLEEEGYPKKTKTIRRVNPEFISKFRYLCKVDIEQMFTKNNEYWQPILISLKQLLAADPSVDQEALTRKILYSYFNSEGEDLMKEELEKIPGVPNMPVQQQMPQGGQLANQLFNKATASAVNNNII